eukprot:scaffold2224_cov154-Amphora_coffeaeformis.AAC.6
MAEARTYQNRRHGYLPCEAPYSKQTMLVSLGIFQVECESGTQQEEERFGGTMKDTASLSR